MLILRISAMPCISRVFRRGDDAWTACGQAEWSSRVRLCVPWKCSRPSRREENDRRHPLIHGRPTSEIETMSVTPMYSEQKNVAAQRRGAPGTHGSLVAMTSYDERLEGG
jgi:hypothetical protein